MKKVFSLSLLLAAMAIADASAQKLDLNSLSAIRRHQLEQSQPALRKAPGTKMAKAQASSQLAFVTLNDGFTSSDLEKAGFEVLSIRGNIAIVKVDVNDATRLSESSCVKAMNLQRKVSTTMDLARKASGIDEIHFPSAETGIPQSYTGKGVVAGIVDQGVDPHHINFRYANGENRISYLTWLRTNATGTDVAESHYNYTTIGDFVTDDAGAYHGTHTLGIMGGSYNGPVTVAKAWEDPTKPESTVYVTETNKYYGVAPEADLAVSCGELQDVFIAYGIEYLLNYAEFMQYPIVYNLSLGATQGPRDKRSTMAQYLDLIGEHAIICISAGNEGDLKLALNKTFTADDTSVKSLIYPYYYQYDPADASSFTARTGSVEIWSEDDTPFEIKAVIYNKKRNYRSAYNMPIAGENIGTYYCSSSDYQVSDDDVIGDQTFCKAFTGYVGVGAKIDEVTGRYYGMVDYYVINNAETNLEDDYVLGFEITGAAGKRIDCYCDGLNTWIDSYGVDGFTDGSTNGTISDMAVADNLIVVGSYNTRNSWLCLDGGTSRYEGDGFKVGGISGFSSYGTLADGRNLPTVCAPGAAIISSVSWPYAKQLSDDFLKYSCSAKLEEDNRVNYWKQEVGTSMSTPLVAGSIALWLEANPDLTVDDVKQIIAETSTVDDEVLNVDDPVRWGAGKFNALEGLKAAIRLSGAGIDNITTDGRNDRLVVTPVGDNAYTIFLGEASSLDVDVYTIDGRRVKSLAAPSDEVTLDLSGLTPGVYVVNANGRHSAKLLVK
ncbi:MAG: S8 family peptidase [Lachnoclostridium sp.]|nr:S8 family peptidase [Lachnoclostridium sp.]